MVNLSIFFFFQFMEHPNLSSGRSLHFRVTVANKNLTEIKPPIEWVKRKKIRSKIAPDRQRSRRKPKQQQSENKTKPKVCVRV